MESEELFDKLIRSGKRIAVASEEFPVLRLGNSRLPDVFFGGLPTVWQAHRYYRGNHGRHFFMTRTARLLLGKMRQTFTANVDDSTRIKTFSIIAIKNGRLKKFDYIRIYMSALRIRDSGSTKIRTPLS